MRRISAWRRSDDEPTVAPCGRSAMRCAALADEGVARILARQEGGELEPVRQHRRHVLGGMHGDVDAAGEQRLLDLLGEQALAAGLRQRPVLDAVAAGRDHHDLERVLRQAMRRHQPRARLMRLRQRQRAAARSDPQTFAWRAVRDNSAG